MSAGPVLRIAAAIILDEHGRMLLVRKRGTQVFMQPGGKLEPGESAGECLVRELAEELGLAVDAASLDWVGRFDAPAANEPGHDVDCDVFRVSRIGVVTVAAEIEEARWFSRESLATVPLAPLTAMNLDAFFS